MALFLQATSLFLLLNIGYIYLSFEISLTQIFILVSSSIIFQIMFCIALKRKINVMGSLISSLSLSILFRSHLIYPLLIISFLTIASKFLIRFKDSHIFNPTNFGLVICTLADLGWISTGQWGNTMWLVYLFFFTGISVAQKAFRIETAASFLVTYALLVIARAYWLGDDFAIPLHNLQSGSILIFSFFMITDPKTTPIKFKDRVIFGISVALLSFLLTFQFYITNAHIYSLFTISLLRAIMARCNATPNS